MQILKKCAKCIASEVKWENFGFEHSDPEEFVKSKWQRGAKSLSYLVFRWILALFFVGLFTACLVLQLSDGTLFIYLTYWGIMLCVVTNVLAVIAVTQWYFNIGTLPSEIVDKSFESRTPRMLKFYWLVHGVTLQLAMVITTIYWVFLHGKQNKPSRFPTLSFITHTFNSVFMTADLLVVAFPMRLLHTVYAMMLPIIYCGFTVIYFHLGGLDEFGNHYIYTILDWKKPALGMTTFAGVFILYVIYTIVIFTTHRIKVCIHKALQRRRKQTSFDVV